MWAVVRVRGTVNVAPKIKKTLELLRLDRPHRLVLIDEKSTVKNMVLTAKDYVTFGEIEEKTLASLLQKRARLEGDKRLTGETFKEMEVKGIEELAAQVLAGKKRLREFGIKEVFRLNSPRKGFERPGIKRAFKIGGVLGYRGTKINNLLEKMM